MFISQIVLILDSNVENSSYAKEFFKDSSIIKAITSDNLAGAYEMITEYEPDLIIAHDNFKEDISDICSKLREKTNFYRPVIMVLSGVQDIDKKINLLRVGADDFQDEAIDKKELSLRIFAHLRRHIDELTDHTTKLPYVSLSYRILKRNLKMRKDELYALMYLDIDNFEPYKEIYGHIAAEKLLQTFIAIIRTSVDEKDFLGRVGEDEFIIFTVSEKAEKIATFLSYYFDMVSPKFYTNEDINRGYLILTGDEKVGRRVPLASVSIGIASNSHTKDIGFEELVNNAVSIHKLAKTKVGSFWVSDRVKITAGEQEKVTEKKILVVEGDASLSYLLATTLEMQGYNVEALNYSEYLKETVNAFIPNLIIFDINEVTAEKDLEICKHIKKNHPHIKIIVSTTDCNKEKILDSGVDLYIPKPYELMVLFSWISRFLNYEVLQ
ncbi:MAG: hypothetical protein A2Y25_08865 [Candidatus Melainabacteria bacterium GWF2_37_15]|nr:MAG: hypothetical protein A2Y25_08865 [Candidatus Melainabacteria bacterium GWF2_37_15]